MFTLLPESIILSIVFIFGAAIGSFLNVLIDRLPRELSINGRSHCDHCAKILSWKDLFPLLSFLLLNGRCRYCGKKINPRFFFVELLTGVVFVLSWMYLGSNFAEKLMYLGILSTLIVVFFTDIKHHIIPDSMQVSLLIFSIGLWMLRGYSVDGLITQIISGVVIMAPLLFLYLITKGRGMGFGDVKISFTIGYLFGIVNGFLVLYIAFVSGAVFGLILLATKKKKLKQAIAFGPFLILGIALMLFYTNEIRHLFSSVFPL